MSLLALQTAFRAWLPGGRGKLPAVFDQGCDPGLRIYRNNYRAPRVANELHALLTQPAYTRRAQEVRQQLQHEDGPGRAADLIEQVFHTKAQREDTEALMIS